MKWRTKGRKGPSRDLCFVFGDLCERKINTLCPSNEWKTNYLPSPSSSGVWFHQVYVLVPMTLSSPSISMDLFLNAIQPPGPVRPLLNTLFKVYNLFSQVSHCFLNFVTTSCANLPSPSSVPPLATYRLISTEAGKISMLDLWDNRRVSRRVMRVCTSSSRASMSIVEVNGMVCTTRVFILSLAAWKVSLISVYSLMSSSLASLMRSCMGVRACPEFGIARHVVLVAAVVDWER